MGGLGECIPPPPQKKCFLPRNYGKGEIPPAAFSQKKNPIF